MNKKLIRITTVPISLKNLLKGQMSFMSKNGFDVIMISSDGRGLNDLINYEKCNFLLRDRHNNNNHPEFAIFVQRTNNLLFSIIGTWIVIFLPFSST